MTDTTIFGISHTTANGWLAAIIGAAGPLAAFLATQSDPRAAWAAGLVTLVATICRVWVGILQGDASAKDPAPAPVSTHLPVPLILLAALILPVLALTGCPTGWEQQTQAALASSKAVIDGAQADYEASANQPGGSCAAVKVPCIPHIPAAFDAINRAKAGQRTAVDAMETYEQLKAAKAGATALQKAENDVAAVMAQIPALIADVKALYRSP